MRPIAVSRPFGRNTFIPAGCIHWPLGEQELLLRWVRAVATAENGFTILLGDSLDCARTHYRNHLKGYRADRNSQLAFDTYIKQDVEKLARILSPIKDRIIGIVLGNHHYSFMDETNSEQYLARLLEIPYLGPLAAIRLDFRDGSRGQVRHRMNLFAHHSGLGRGALTIGGDINAMLRNEGSWDADVYVVGHTHRRHAVKQVTCTLSIKGQPRVIHRTKAFIRAGAFLKSLQEDKPSALAPHFPHYAEEAAYRPTDLGWVTLTLDMQRGHGRDSARTEMVVSY